MKRFISFSFAFALCAFFSIGCSERFAPTAAPTDAPSPMEEMSAAPQGEEVAMDIPLDSVQVGCLWSKIRASQGIYQVDKRFALFLNGKQMFTAVDFQRCAYYGYDGESFYSIFAGGLKKNSIMAARELPGQRPVYTPAEGKVDFFGSWPKTISWAREVFPNGDKLELLPRSTEKSPAPPCM